jgi:hypothetical protein
VSKVTNLELPYLQNVWWNWFNASSLHRFNIFS